MTRIRIFSAGRVGGSALAVGTLVAGGMAAPAWSVAPGNDEPAGATPVALGDHVTEDTTQATIGASDATYNSNCGAPTTTASVWFTYTAAADGGVVLDMSASDYSGGFLVFDGTPSAGSLYGCGQTTVAFTAVSGSTYYVMAIDDNTDGNLAVGGNLVMDVAAAPPPPTVNATVNPNGKVDKFGNALISGTYSCTNSDTIELDGDVTQRVGRIKIHGFGSYFDQGTCDGATHPFTMVVTADNGLFAGGKAATVTFTFACGPFDCSDGYVQQVVKLNKGK